MVKPKVYKGLPTSYLQVKQDQLKSNKCVEKQKVENILSDFFTHFGKTKHSS